jgi:hypothetical protein
VTKWPDVTEWPLRSVLAGAAGTAAMTAAYAVERRLVGARRRARGPLDYDDSRVPGQIVVSILHLPAVLNRDDEEIGMALRFGYGSLFGLWHGELRRRMREPWASAAFEATLLTITVTMFPLLGRTPPPWRWPRSYMATCLATHTIYTVAVALTDDRVSRS